MDEWLKEFSQWTSREEEATTLAHIFIEEYLPFLTPTLLHEIAIKAQKEQTKKIRSSSIGLPALPKPSLVSCSHHHHCSYCVNQAHMTQSSK